MKLRHRIGRWLLRDLFDQANELEQLLKSGEVKPAKFSADGSGAGPPRPNEGYLLWRGVVSRRARDARGVRAADVVKFLEPPPGKQWKWRPEILAVIGGTLLSRAIFGPVHLSVALSCGCVLFFLVGWRLETKRARCVACGSMIPEEEAADLARCVYVRRDELEKLLAKPSPPRPS